MTTDADREAAAGLVPPHPDEDDYVDAIAAALAAEREAALAPVRQALADFVDYRCSLEQFVLRIRAAAAPSPATNTSEGEQQ